MFTLKLWGSWFWDSHCCIHCWVIGIDFKWHCKFSDHPNLNTKCVRFRWTQGASTYPLPYLYPLVVCRCLLQLDRYHHPLHRRWLVCSLRPQILPVYQNRRNVLHETHCRIKCCLLINQNITNALQGPVAAYSLPQIMGVWRNWGPRLGHSDSGPHFSFTGPPQRLIHQFKAHHFQAIVGQVVNLSCLVLGSAGVIFVYRCM